MSQSLKNDISKGEQLADRALRAVFESGASPPRGSDTFAGQNEKKYVQEKGSVGSTTLFRASDHASDGKRHLLLSCTGSVATIKLPNMLRALSQYSSILSTRVILTSSSAHFLQGQAGEQPTIASLAEIPGVDGIYRDEDEWDPAWTRGAPILHIELRRWADLLVVAPLSANTLAKIVNGMCDNLLTSVIRAWDPAATVGFINKTMAQRIMDGVIITGEVTDDTTTMTEMKAVGRKKILLAPAMNTAMWNHPITAKQLKTLQTEWPWTRVLLPLNDKKLACGDVGTGAMKEWSDIVQDIEDELNLSPFKGKI